MIRGGAEIHPKCSVRPESGSVHRQAGIFHAAGHYISPPQPSGKSLPFSCRKARRCLLFPLIYDMMIWKNLMPFPECRIKGVNEKMPVKRMLACLMTLMLMLLSIPAMADTLSPLPMDRVSPGPAPKDENYLSATEYADESITVKIGEGRYADTDYVYAHVKISHPSQLRTAPAAVVNSASAGFVRTASEANFRGRYVAKAVNAVVAMNGDFYTKTDMVKVVLRQGKQVRNIAAGLSDLLIIDMNGNFSYLPTCTKEDYEAYYNANQESLYQVFCFGPVLVENGEKTIGEDYQNNSVGSHKGTQRSAIAQLGPLEYLLITCNGSQTKNNKGMTILEFATLCETVGKELSESGCVLAYNLDGGNSSTLVFKEMNKKTGNLNYVKVNCPEIERFLGDMIYFATLVN